MCVLTYRCMHIYIYIMIYNDIYTTLQYPFQWGTIRSNQAITGSELQAGLQACHIAARRFWWHIFQSPH